VSFNRGFGIFFDKGGINTPTAFSQFINKLVSTPEVIVFFHMRPLEYPTVPADERFVVSQIKFMPNCYRVVCRHGYMDEIVTEDLAAIIYGHLRAYVTDKSNRRPSLDYGRRNSSVHDGDDEDEKKVQQDGHPEKYGLHEQDAATQQSELPSQLTLSQLQAAYDHRVLYVIGKEEMHVKRGTGIWRKLLLKTFLFFRDNTRNKMANLKVPTDRLVEIGFLKDV